MLFVCLIDGIGQVGGVVVELLGLLVDFVMLFLREPDRPARVVKRGGGSACRRACERTREGAQRAGDERKNEQFSKSKIHRCLYLPTQGGKNGAAQDL